MSIDKGIAITSRDKGKRDSGRAITISSLRYAIQIQKYRDGYSRSYSRLTIRIGIKK